MQSKDVSIRRALIMTWFRSNNYGTLLQSYATKEIFKERYGIDLYFVNYTPKGKRDFLSVLKKTVSAKTWKKQFQNLYSKIEFHKHGLEPYLRTRREWVDDFISEYYMVENGRNIVSREDFNRLTDEFDLFVSGSDQIWNPKFVNEHFLLDFVLESKCSIAFASSLSADRIPDDKIDIYRKHLKKYCGITIREPDCSEQLSEITGKEVGVILDPTLLYGADRWLCKASSIEEHNYVLAYFLGNSRLVRESAITIARDRKAKLYWFPHMSEIYQNSDEIMPKNTALWDVNPYEWISWVYNAEFILTDSFHMTAFCIMFHKQFYVTVKDQNNMQQNNRILNLLKLVGLESRFIPVEKLTVMEYESEPEPEWDMVDRKLSVESMNSFSYVDNMMEIVKTYVGGYNRWIIIIYVAILYVPAADSVRQFARNPALKWSVMNLEPLFLTLIWKYVLDAINVGKDVPL